MTISHISEILLKNNKKEIALIIEKENQFSFGSFVWGYDAYTEIWTPNIRGDSFYLKCENENKHDKSVMDVMIRG